MVCVLGPTASGKTRYAVALAKQLEEATGKKVEIISGDSRQVYRGMDIGTGKDLCEYGTVPYHLIDIRPAGEKYNLFEYKKDFSAAYSDIVGRGAIPLLCGGTGLYIEAVTCGYRLDAVPEDASLRASLETLPMENLIKIFESYATPHNVTDYDSRKRLIRAIEIAKYEAENGPAQACEVPLPAHTYFIGTLVERDERNAKIDARLKARLDDGMVAEIQGLLDSGIPAEDLEYYGLEYKFVTQYLTGKLSYEQMCSSLATAIHQFAKRQMTWFRGMERKGIKIHWTRL
ncbi:MAG: tRNA (adenosine(37)-N6)-dimethylallyltransferase MiaA [Bacteroidales bacterium]|nr:tRNA (adenosine(37)-N6)-dimethylallyltransferase MiaA [Bacteroidales bacterium]